MNTIEPENEYLEDENAQSPAFLQINRDGNTYEYRETKEPVLSKTEENKPPLKKKDHRSEKRRRRLEREVLVLHGGSLNNFLTNPRRTQKGDFLCALTICCTRQENCQWLGCLFSQDGCRGDLGFLNMLATGAILIMIWCMTWSLVGPVVLPGGSLFGFFIVFYGAFIGGKLLELIAIPPVPPLPPLLGFEGNERRVFETVCGPMPDGGLLNGYYFPLPDEFSLAVGIAIRSLSFSFVVGAVSPAIVVPSMLLLQERGYGIKKGIPTVLIAASSVDDIVAITGFNTCYSIVFSSGGVLRNLLFSCRDVFIGVLVGAVLGMFLRYFPSRDQTDLALKRAFLVLSMGVSVVLGSHRSGLHAAGGLCSLVLTFSSGIHWSKEKVKVQIIIAKTWNVFQPLLFGLVGWEVSVASLRNNAIGICAASITLALLVRISFTFVISSFAGFSFKEKIFIALAWIPKATVQAVLGPLALETARASAPHLEMYSQHVMTVAFLAILITAPNGALFISILGTRILTHHNPSLVKTDWSGSTFH